MLTWTEAISTGVDTIDKEHQMLFGKFNELEEALNGAEMEQRGAVSAARETQTNPASPRGRRFILGVWEGRFRFSVHGALGDVMRVAGGLCVGRGPVRRRAAAPSRCALPWVARLTGVRT